MMNTRLHLLIVFFALALTSSIQAQTNQYLHFDRIDDYVAVPNASQYIANSTGITMAGWFYTDELVYGQGMMGIRDGAGATGEMYVIQLDNGKLECRLTTNGTLYEYASPTFTVVPQVWQHIAWVYDGSQVKLYIDGVLKGSKAAAGTITSTTKTFGLGKSLLGGFNFVFGGRMDEVSLWSKGLTQQEIQDMMDNELTGTEPGLELYYKFNQGVPGEDNTSISKLVSETGNGDRDGSLLNFALTGNTSNFGGDLDVSFQAITFPQIPNKLVSDVPFQLGASASSGLPVSYEIVSGPATLSGDVVTLTGQPGEVTVKASQPGNGTFDPAVDAVNTFQVLDPNTYVPEVDARSPLAGDVFVPVLKPIQLAAISSIGYPELFHVTGLKFEINGEEILAKDWGNDHYTAWWTPPAYGPFTLTIISTNNYGASATQAVNLNIVEQASDISTLAINAVWADVANGVVEVEAELPSYLGAFDQITGLLNIQCPAGGCDPWDRISGIEAKGHNGEWYEIIRYITPYGVPCSHSIDLTDFMSTLQGKIRFRVYLGTLGNGFLYTLDLEYKKGQPAHPYSTITQLWRETYDFGDPSHLQPVENLDIDIPNDAKAAKMKLVSTGHGWGDNNTGNAAEFHEDTHHIWVNGVQTFEQHNWQACNPNPDGCSPQNGTWFYARAGWCPGSIAPWFDYDMAPYISQGPLTLGYVFDEDYEDLCNSNNPNCVSGVTCPDCNDGFDPHLIVASYLITNGDAPLDGLTGLEETAVPGQLAFQVFPNPTTGLLNVAFKGEAQQLDVRVYNHLGQLVRRFDTEGFRNSASFDLGKIARGMYSVEVRTERVTGIQKLVVE
ncbi:MAG: T9SS type A sorting domain-containing protein [Lewinellaceae bacterium]|nr:T9SS type A sorting domain-containing protein [Saprospiraceae bacterium]MCB9337171.1 T9SS type A sorting domain-containing protein [Lewinellaceae bacterium]